MAGLSSVTRDDVLDVLAMIDREGVRTFLGRTHYKDSIRYTIYYRGRRYPSKAVIGVAAGLRPDEFFGGVAQVVPALLRLGFHVREGEAPVADVGLARLARKYRLEKPRFSVDPAAYFHSGTNRPGEIRGLATCGGDVGVAVPELSRKSIDELKTLAGTDVQVFVDSGAFSEVDSDLEVVRPMSDLDWDRVFSTYFELAEALEDQLWIVAPDRVGDQVVTLDRLAKYQDELRELRELGVRVLVPIQRGILGPLAFWNAVRAILGFEPIPAVPCKKGATPPSEVSSLVATLSPKHVHLLGLGPRNRRIEEYIESLGESSYSLDSNWITANVGRKGKTRLFTRAKDRARHLLGRSTTAVLATLAMYLAHDAWGL